MFDGYQRPDRYRVKQLSDLFVLQRDAAPGPIATGAVAVNEDLTSQVRVLKRHALSFQCADDLIVLGACYESVAKTSLGVSFVWIAELKRQIELALRVPPANVELAFGCASVAGLYFVFDRARAQADGIFSNNLARGEQSQKAFAFGDDDAGIHKRKREGFVIWLPSRSR
jgi:hypothetical protein